MIREGELLAHDKDLDFGLLPGASLQVFADRIEQTDEFIFTSGSRPSLSAKSCAVAHVKTGLIFDVIAFYKDGDGWSGDIGISGQCTGHWFTPFKLEPFLYQGVEVWIPANAEHWLEQMYGVEWRTPHKTYDSLIDAENLNRNGLASCKHLAFKRFLANLNSGNVPKTEYYEEWLIRHGELWLQDLALSSRFSKAPLEKKS